MMKKIISEFKEFISRGSVFDLAVGIVIGSAFGKIVGSFVSDIVMPPLGVLIAGIRIDQLKWEIQDAVVAADGSVLEPAVSINYGSFIQATINFLIIAVFIFLFINAVNRLRRKIIKAEEKKSETYVPTMQEKTLLEIRDLLKEKKTEN